MGKTLEEFLFVISCTNRRPKITIKGPKTLKEVHSYDGSLIEIITYTK